MLERTHVPRWLSLLEGSDDFFGLLTPLKMQALSVPILFVVVSHSYLVV